MSVGLQVALQILSMLFGSASLVTLIIFLIKRRDENKSMLKKILKQLEKQERDNCRTQLLLMMSDYAKNTAEIMQLAEHYFKDIDGNWYASSIFAEYLKTHGLAVPLWFSQK